MNAIQLLDLQVKPQYRHNFHFCEKLRVRVRDPEMTYLDPDAGCPPADAQIYHQLVGFFHPPANSYIT